MNDFEQSLYEGVTTLFGPRGAYIGEAYIPSRDGFASVVQARSCATGQVTSFSTTSKSYDKLYWLF